MGIESLTREGRALRRKRVHRLRTRPIPQLPLIADRPNQQQNASSQRLSFIRSDLSLKYPEYLLKR